MGVPTTEKETKPDASNYSEKCGIITRIEESPLVKLKVAKLRQGPFLSFPLNGLKFQKFLEIGVGAPQSSS